MFTLSITCLFLLQNPSGQGLSLPICARTLWRPTKAFGSRFQKVLLKKGHLLDTASAWRQHDKLAATKRRPKRRGLQHCPLTPEPELLLEHIGEAEGSGTLCACLTALGTEVAPRFGCLVALAPGSLQAQLRPPALLKGTLISENSRWSARTIKNTHSLKYVREVSDEGCSPQTTLGSPCCWC